MICHQQLGSPHTEGAAKLPLTGPNYVCEHFQDVTSFGIDFTSYACHLKIKDGRVTEFWFYMD